MRPLNFYDLGLRLAEEGRTEAERRTGVSRLYYGLHHEAACRYFRVNPDAPPIPRNRRHAALREVFRALGTPLGADIASRLRRLAWLRGECDYRVGAPLRYAGSEATLSTVVAEALETAAACLAALDAYSPASPPTGRSGA